MIALPTMTPTAYPSRAHQEAEPSLMIQAAIEVRAQNPLPDAAGNRGSDPTQDQFPGAAYGWRIDRALRSYYSICMEIDPSILRGGDVLNIELVKSSLKGAEDTPFSDAIETFADNIKQVSHLLRLPLYLVYLYTMRLEETLITFDVMLADEPNTIAISKGKGDPSKVAKIIAERMKEVSSDRVAEKGVPDYVQILNNVKPIRSAVFDLQRSSLIWSWTAFEVLASDLWVAAVNAAPHKVWKAIANGGSKGKERKSVPIDLLAKHDFDLRSALGTALRKRFRFTNLRAIAKAFNATFPKNSFDAVFDSPALTNLEATRHLIVHRAGRVDDEYKKRTGCTLDEGTTLPLTDSDIREWINAAIEAADRLVAVLLSVLAEGSHGKGSQRQSGTGTNHENGRNHTG